MGNWHTPAWDGRGFTFVPEEADLPVMYFGEGEGGFGHDADLVYSSPEDEENFVVEVKWYGGGPAAQADADIADAPRAIERKVDADLAADILVRSNEASGPDFGSREEGTVQRELGRMTLDALKALGLIEKKKIA